MLFTEPHTVYLRTKQTDAYGTITGTVDTPFNCYAERRSKFAYTDNQQLEIGKGTVYTTCTLLTFTVGDTLVVNSEEFLISRAYRYEGIDGCFSHWELMYA